MILQVIKGEYSFSFSKLGQVYSTVLLVIINLVEREEGEGREGKERRIGSLKSWYPANNFNKSEECSVYVQK